MILYNNNSSHETLFLDIEGGRVVRAKDSIDQQIKILVTQYKTKPERVQRLADKLEALEDAWGMGENNITMNNQRKNSFDNSTNSEN